MRRFLGSLLAALALGVVHPAVASAATLKAGQSFTFAEQGATTVTIDARQNGATLAIRQSDKFNAYTVTLANTGLEGQTLIQWGLPAGPVIKLSIKVTTGTLGWKAILLDSGTLVPPSTAGALPVLTVYGDSIADGWLSGGPINDSAGYADQLAGSLGYRLSSSAVPGKTAVCWGQNHVADVVKTHPSLVIEAFGTNDVVGFFCNETMDQFRAAVDSMLSQLIAGLPGVPIYVSAILPRQNVDVSPWNQVLQNEAAAYGLSYVDPSSSLVLWSDYADNVHPNLSGHTHLAAYWGGLLGGTGQSG